MKKFYRIRNLVLLGLLLLLPGMTKLYAQTVHYNAALMFVQQGDIDSAKKEIDTEMQQPGTQTRPECLYLAGVIYKEMYKRYEGTNYNSAYRVTALDYFEKSLSIDTNQAAKKVTRDNIRFIALRYYNDAVATLDTVHYDTSIKCYNQYRTAALVADPGFDIQKKDVEFYLALASTYSTIYNLDKKKNARFFDLTRDTYLQVLKWDANNYTANYNIGLLFWNKGVDIIYDVNYDDSLTNVFDTQDKSVELFKQSLPFAEKAYQIEPKREETLIVLSGIYYSLNEFQKSDAYKQMLEDLRKNR